MTIRVVLGEDNVLVREGVRALLDSYEDIEVVGVAQDAPTLMAAAAEHVPDVVVTDIKMPPSFQLEGIDCAHAIRHDHPDTGVVVLSAHDDEEYAIALLGGGHSGLAYLLKDRIAQGDELVRAIHEVHAGGSAVDPVIAERLTGSKHADDEDRAILDMMSKGLGYADMARELGTTQEAVDRRVTELFGRMAGDGAGAGLLGEFKRLHAAVVEQAAGGRKTMSFFFPPPSSSPTVLPPIRRRRSSRRSSSSPSCSATSAGSPRLPSGSPPATSRRSSVATSRPWPRWYLRTAARSTSSRETPSWRSSAHPTRSTIMPSARSAARSACSSARRS
jgi:DNA-binding NarL/FixJ family response regulator